MRYIALFFVVFLVRFAPVAQLSGVYTIPGSYPTIAAAVTAVNAVGVSGHVYFNIDAGHTENAPVGGIVLQFAGGVLVGNQSNAAQTITFQKSGAGANPLINAFTGTQAANSAVSLDGIFKIVGVDYVTINGVDLSEIGGNVSDPNYMEMGYGLLRTSATNGTQNCSIQNCVITLNNQHTGVWPASLAPLIGSVGIFSGPITNASTTALAGSSTTGANSNNSFYGNTLQNVSTGIAIKGIADGAPYVGYDLSNIVGSTAVSGNTVQNFKYYGVYTVCQNGLSIASNTINNMSGGGSAPTESFYGIYNDITTNSTSTIASNTINLTSGVMAVAGTCYAITECAVGTGTANINFNTITLSGGGGLTSFYGIIRPTGLSLLANYNVGDNNFRNFNISTTSAAGLATLALILNNNNAIDNQSYTNNYTSGSSTPYIVVSGTNLQSFYGIATTSAAQTSGTLSFLNNSLTNITINNPNGFCYGIYANSGTVAANAINVTVSNCHINNIILVGGNYTGILVTKAHSLATINNNWVENISGAINVYGIQSGIGSNLNIYNNVVRSLTPASLFIGIYSASDAYGTIRNNEIYNCSVTGSTANGPSYGIRSENVPGGFTINIFENSIYNLSVGGTGIMNLAGISLASTAGGTFNVYNNLIADLSLTASAAGNALHGIHCGRGVYNIYFNTVVLGYGTSLTSTATDFIVTGLYYQGNTNSLDLRNNIIYVSATPNGTGFVSAVRRSAGLAGTAPANFAGSSNYNIYYAPNVANSYLYSEGTTTANVVNAFNLTNDPEFNFNKPCSLYKTFMTTANEDSTATEIPPFIGAGIPSVKYSLINGTLSYAESGAQTIGLVPTDFNAVSRPNNLVTNRPDIGFTEFAGIKNSFGICVVLPIELLSFSGKPKDKYSEITWVTATEINNDYFTLEKSDDLIDWREITRTKGAGNSTQILNYSYNDYEILSEVMYYRLKQTDYNGEFKYSNIITLAHKKGIESEIFPNPSSGLFTIISDEEITSIKIFDSLGKILFENTNKIIDLYEFENGLYSVVIISDNKITVKKIIKK